MNVTAWDWAAPATVMLPEAGCATYPDALTVNAYVPFALENWIVAVVEDKVEPPSVTDQLDPYGKPVSVKVK